VITSSIKGHLILSQTWNSKTTFS